MTPLERRPLATASAGLPPARAADPIRQVFLELSCRQGFGWCTPGAFKDRRLWARSRPLSRLLRHRKACVRFSDTQPRLRTQSCDAERVHSSPAPVAQDVSERVYVPLGALCLTVLPPQVVHIARKNKFGQHVVAGQVINVLDKV